VTEEKDRDEHHDTRHAGRDRQAGTRHDDGDRHGPDRDGRGCEGRGCEGREREGRGCEGLGYEALERRDRAIVRHVVLSLVAGIAAGAAGTAIHTAGLTALDAIYDPYAYFVLAIAVGSTAAGFRWAAPAGSLAACGPLIPVLVGLGLTQRLTLTWLGSSASGLDLLVLLLFLCAVAAHSIRRRDLWGDVVAGLLSGALLADVAERALTGAAHTGRWFAPWGALITGVIVLAPALAARPTPAGRGRSLGLALLIGAGCVFGVSLAR
jgi:hypothetical protein